MMLAAKILKILFQEQEYMYQRKISVRWSRWILLCYYLHSSKWSCYHRTSRVCRN
jgi:hypothetical protein